MSALVIAGWIALASFVYGAGFIIAGAIEERTCPYCSAGHKRDGWGRTHKCAHPFDTAGPALWPVLVAIAVAFAPLWIPLVVGTKVAPWLASRETPAERRDRLAVERDKRVQEQAATIARLEREAGIR